MISKVRGGIQSVGDEAVHVDNLLPAIAGFANAAVVDFAYRCVAQKPAIATPRPRFYAVPIQKAAMVTQHVPLY